MAVCWIPAAVNSSTWRRLDGVGAWAADMGRESGGGGFERVKVSEKEKDGAFAPSFPLRSTAALVAVPTQPRRSMIDHLNRNPHTPAV